MTAIPQAIERAAEALHHDFCDDLRLGFWCAISEHSEGLQAEWAHKATIALEAAMRKPCEAEGCVNGAVTTLYDPGDYARGEADVEACDQCNGSGFRSLPLVDDVEVECAEKHCERRADYGATLIFGRTRFEVSFCKEHFDGLDSDRPRPW